MTQLMRTFFTKWITAVAIMMLGGGAIPVLALECHGVPATATDKQICADSNLLELDDQLNRVWRMRMSISSGQEQTSLKQAQQGWLAGIRNTCSDTDCLRKAYMARIAMLQLINADNGVSFLASGNEFVNQQNAFSRSLRAEGITQLQCQVIIRLSATGIGRDESYGALCSTATHRKIMICDDTMIGKLTVKYGYFAISPKDLADFTSVNCPPGG